MRILVVSAVLLGSMAVPAAGAWAGPPIGVREKTVSPAAVVLADGRPATVRIHVETDVVVTGKAVPLQPSAAPYGRACTPAEATTGAGDVLDLLCTIEPDARPGIWTIPLELSAPGRGGVAVLFPVEVRRKTAIDHFTLTPEQPRPGRKVLFRGRLRRFDGHTMKPYAYQPVLLSVRVGDSNWDLAVQTRTDLRGRFTVSPRIRTSGRWQALFLGTDHYAKSVSQPLQAGRRSRGSVMR